MEVEQVKQEILNRNLCVPRYTSYPTAPHFKTVDEHNEGKVWLGNLPKNSCVSLYLHIPFCTKLCYYCGCNTKVANKYTPIKTYLELLIKEISIISEAITPLHKVNKIHFGGGSPTILKPEDFAHLIKELGKSFNIQKNAEVAIEIDPRQVTEGKVATYAKYGVNRVSLGVQSFNQKVMASVNRPQPFHLTYEAFNLFNTYGIKNINVDLMYGLPYQTVERVKRTAEYAALLKPKRIALFGYAHVPWLKKHMQLIDINTLPNAHDRYDLFGAAAQALEEHNYHQIGIDHFAKKDDELFTAFKQKRLKRNFQGYTDDNSDALIGLGVSAISSLPDGFYQNTIEHSQYTDSIENSELAISKQLRLTEHDKMIAKIIEELMCYQKTYIYQTLETYGFKKDTLNNVLNRLESLEKGGLVLIDKTSGKIEIPENAIHATRLICSYFDEYIKEPSKKKHTAIV